MSFHVTVITLVPEIFPGPLQASLIGKALTAGLWRLTVVSLKEYGIGVHKAVDDSCYGGGAGMVIRPDVVDKALQEIVSCLEDPLLIYMSPRGDLMTQAHLSSWIRKKNLVLLCGRYEGIDERVLQLWGFQEISLGDFVLCGGDLPAMALIEGCVRLLPGVIGNSTSLQTESFQNGLLEHPHYTRPAEWCGLSVPEILTSGHHQRIQQWQHEQSLKITAQRRPDLWAKYQRKDI